MGRPKKYNLQYFPLDVTFWDDHKIISIEEAARTLTNDPKAGIIAGYIAQRIMAMVYADQGYFLNWPEKFEMTVAKRIGNSITGTEVKQVLDYCLQFELFDREIFEKHQKITSHGIQKRWLLVQTQLRRQIDPDPEIWVVTSEETTQKRPIAVVTSEETTTPATLSTQKEIKGNKIENDVEAQSAAPASNLSSPPQQPAETGTNNSPKRKRIAGAEKFVPPTFQEAIDYFTNKCYKPANPGTWFPDKCQTEANDFVNFYTANGWKQGSKGSGKPIVSWTAAANMWISRAKKGEFGGPVSNNTPGTPQPTKDQTVHRARAKELPIMQRDLNYLYEKFLENPDLLTTMSISVPDYDYLKANKMAEFDQEKKAEIRKQALENLKPISATPDEALVVQMMKKIGVIEVFKRLKSEGLKIIFQ